MAIKKLLLRSKAIKRLVANAIIIISNVIPFKKLVSLGKHLKYSKVFRDAELIYSDKGYWMIEPMPSDADLAKYYSNIYWDNFHDGKNDGIEPRAIEQFIFINENIEIDTKNSKNILNFGAGEGGISKLFHLNEWKVTNVEPSLMADFNWNKVDKIEDTNEEFDILFSSHSLEHVNDLDKYLKLFEDRIKPGGYLFIEVPDCKNSHEIASPHTYYFTKKFFTTLSFNVLYLNEDLDCYNEKVIRYIGQKI